MKFSTAVKLKGFTLIELIVFIVIISILASAILLSFVTVMSKTPITLQSIIANQTAKQCAEWFIGQRRMNGYSSITCNSTVPAFCTVPSGYTLTANCSTTPISGDTNYETITITVSGAGSAVLTFLIANY
jgi:prepilin-type N-terminal cleavage/methylation domain-containing protein